MTDTKKQKQILETIQTLLNEYLEWLTLEERNILDYLINHLGQLSIETIEVFLQPILEKIWEKELNTGKYIIISWKRFETKKEQKRIVFATLSEKSNIISYCGFTIGIIYEITYKSLLGAHWKDGATVIEDKSKKGKYTIGMLDENVINSYNEATKLITPKQLIRKREHDYKSKHNELVLDSRYIQEVGLYYLES